MNLRVLVTNNTLAKRAGTELYVRDICFELKRLGHTPIAFTTLSGVVSEEMASHGLQVVTSLEGLEEPDIIHGQHLFETLIATLRFPSTPAIFVCHGALPWVERPPLIPSIRRYVAADLACRERVAKEAGLPLDQVKVIHRFVDLKRFRPRSPLPERPAQALIFGEEATEGAHVPFVREACRRAGIGVDTLQADTGRASESVGDYDIVFAKGRFALEAIAVGCAVVLCDAEGCGPMVRADEIERLRDWNFGLRLLTEPLLPRTIEKQMALYDAADAGRCRDYVRANCGLETVAEELIALYSEVVEEARAQEPIDGALVSQAVSVELTRVRREMGDQLWRFDPPRMASTPPKKGRLGRKIRSIGHRIGELAAEFRPGKNDDS